MASRKEQELPQSKVTQFYDGKSVLITGAAGYLGTILLEILLSYCPGVQRIYILLREKRGVLPEDRKKSIFKKEIFYKIKEKYPDIEEKVIVISGDVTHENLGMNDDVLRKVAEEVSIVFHMAASISFLKPLRFILVQNVIATYNVMELCGKLKHVDCLVYTSTAYSNCNRKTIDEIVYKVPFRTDDILKAIRNGSDQELKILFEKFTPNFPNFYTFSKCLSEHILAETADFPVAIVRPSIVGCCWKGSLPGYIEEGSGLYSISVGVGKGFIRVMQMDKNLLVDHIPVDIVANTHIAAAWCQITERLPSPYVYNCASSDIVPYTWGEICFTLLKSTIKHPIPNSYQRPALKIFKSNVAYWFHSILDHYSPAIVIDTFLWISGRKPRLFKLYRFYDKMMSTMNHFYLNEWKIRSVNFQSLALKLNSTDSEIFPVDIREYSIEETAQILPTGASIYKWENDKKSYEERMQTVYIRYLQTSFIKWSFIGLLIFMCYSIIF